MGNIRKLVIWYESPCGNGYMVDEYKIRGSVDVKEDWIEFEPVDGGLVSFKLHRVLKYQITCEI